MKVQAKVRDFFNNFTDVIRTSKLATRLTRKQKILGVISTTIFVLLIVVMISVAGNEKKQSQQSISATNTTTKKALVVAELSGKLEDINAQLAKINNAVETDKTLSNQQKQGFEKEIATITGSMSGIAKESTVTAVSNTLSQDTAVLTKKVDSLQEAVTALSSEVQQGDFIDAKNLPFEIQSIDMWNGQAYASIKLNNHTQLLAKNDEQMGWVVMSLNYSTQQAVLENNKKQFIKVQLRG